MSCLMLSGHLGKGHLVTISEVIITLWELASSVQFITSGTSLQPGSLFSTFSLLFFP